jgi:hypothetical protein
MVPRIFVVGICHCRNGALTHWLGLWGEGMRYSPGLCLRSVQARSLLDVMSRFLCSFEMVSRRAGPGAWRGAQAWCCGWGLVSPVRTRS